ncbi:MAG TPA: peptide permease, partial [Clostridium sp.]|nr:peptide permease [Clostridium sp.]
FITETVFGWPGMGRLGINSIFSMDYPVIMAITMMTSIMVILGNLIADLFYILVDPRIKVVGHK